ncbi:hypothetical protein LOC54_10135 [Acetobacter sp. AN02]|uniref:hypothetical protein n=1 Tax=Acetobacter sp. AN02 TaxID=2894186 RepID=UPI0024342D8F|nr:hypothetical protein [Acetobacter sp. AN02]MDG6095455.1 hypothetical protein [Acetobacter sp. AN02]
MQDELWLLDWWGRFLHNDPFQDRLTAVAMDECPTEGPGIFLRINPADEHHPVILSKRVPAPVPLPQIEPEFLEPVGLGLRVTDTDGFWENCRDRWIGTEPDGGVRCDRTGLNSWEMFLALPSSVGRLLTPEIPIHIRLDESGESVRPVPVAEQRIAIGDRLYPTLELSSFLDRMSRLKAGESVPAVLPPCGDQGEAAVTLVYG